MSEDKKLESMALEELIGIMIAAKDEYEVIKEKHRRIERDIENYIREIDYAVRFRQIVGYRVFESRVNPYSEIPLESFQTFDAALDYAKAYFERTIGRTDFQTTINIRETSALLVFVNDLSIHWRVNVQPVTSKPVNVLGDILDV